MVSLTTELAKEPRGLKLKCLRVKLRVYYCCHSSLSTTLAGKPWRLSTVFCLGLCSRMCHHYLSPDSLNSTSPQTPCTLPGGPHTYEGWQQNEKSLWFFTVVDPNLHRPRIQHLILHIHTEHRTSPCSMACSQGRDFSHQIPIILFPFVSF